MYNGEKEMNARLEPLPLESICSILRGYSFLHLGMMTFGQNPKWCEYSALYAFKWPPLPLVKHPYTDACVSVYTTRATTSDPKVASHVDFTLQLYQ